MIAQCIAAYAQLRPEPRHASELVSQIILGEPVQVLATEGAWIKILTEHNYEGFTRTEQFRFLSKEPDFPKELFRLASTLSLKTISGNPYTCFEGSLIFDGNETGFLPGFPANELIDITNSIRFDPQLMATQSKSLLNTPYVWGGKTAFGLDCSGLVQFLLQKQGYSFPRDAWQQSEIGSEVKFNSEKPEFTKGDLLYFQNPGKRIHHVAVSLGGSEYIHSSDWVRVNSFDPSKREFVRERFETLCLAKRLKTKDLLSLFESFKRLWDLGV